MAETDETGAHKPDAQPTRENDTITTADAQRDREIDGLRRRESTLFVLAILGFVVATASVVVSLMQWRSMRNQLDDARTQMRLEYRPWILVQRAVLEEPLTIGKPPRLRVYVINGGRTPAVNVQFCHDVNVDGRQLPTAFSFVGRDDDTIIVAGESAETLLTLHEEPLTETRLQEISTNYHPLFMRAYVTYDDIFGEAHRTDVCYVTSPRGGQGAVIACSANNHVD